MEGRRFSRRRALALFGASVIAGVATGSAATSAPAAPPTTPRPTEGAPKPAAAAAEPRSKSATESSPIIADENLLRDHILTIARNRATRFTRDSAQQERLAREHAQAVNPVSYQRYHEELTDPANRGVEEVILTALAIHPTSKKIFINRQSDAFSPTAVKSNPSFAKIHEINPNGNPNTTLNFLLHVGLDEVFPTP